MKRRSPTSNLEKIITDCKKQKRDAQSALYLLFVDKLHNAALRYCRDAAEAKDLVHDAFLKIFEKFYQFKGNSNQLYAWLLRIVINEALQKKRRVKRLFFTDELPEIEPLDGLEIVLANLGSEEIWDLIKSMSEEEQLILNLHLVDELPHEDISKLLDISVANSRTRLSRAKLKIRTLIKQQTINQL